MITAHVAFTLCAAARSPFAPRCRVPGLRCRCSTQLVVDLPARLLPDLYDYRLTLPPPLRLRDVPPDRFTLIPTTRLSCAGLPALGGRLDAVVPQWTTLVTRFCRLRSLRSRWLVLIYDCSDVVTLVLCRTATLRCRFYVYVTFTVDLNLRLLPVTLRTLIVDAFRLR